MKYSTYHDILNEELERRKIVNESYSLRAFARDLNLPVSSLSLIMNRKQGISIKVAQKIAKKLKLTVELTQWFCSSAGSLHAKSFKDRTEFQEKIKTYKMSAKTYSEVQLEYFKVISDWYHFAILELTYLEEFQNDTQWIANVLDISQGEVETAIKRMKDLDLLREKDGKLVDVFKFLATPNDTPSMSLKKYNVQLMKKAMTALYEQDVLEREYASNIFAIDKDKLPQYKEKLRNFRRELEYDASQSNKKNAVYCLAMQFYNLTGDIK